MNMSISSSNPAAVSSIRQDRPVNSAPKAMPNHVNDPDKPLPEHIDLRNISMNEVNELIKAGHEIFLEVKPFVSPFIIAEHGKEYAANIKVDYLGQIESSIAYKRSVNEDTSFLDNVLESLLEIQGKEFPSRVDTYA